MTHPIALIILDGFGYKKEKDFNAVAQAHAPHLNEWFKRYPHTILQASGKAVGLPAGIMGNSEVGHLTIGAGRVVKQPVTIINDAIDDGSFFKNQKLLDALHSLPPGSTLHLMGLLSDAGVHSEIKHLFAYIRAAREAGITSIVIHAFLDGRDTAPQSAASFVQKLDAFLDHSNECIGSVHGRFYAMDRDNNWERTKASYTVLTSPAGETATSWQAALDQAYREGVTDEFILPTHVKPDRYIRPHDGVIFFNFRPDRARQLTEAFVLPHFTHFERPSLALTFFVTPVDYGLNLNTTVLFPSKPLQNTLKEVLATAGKRMFSIAETEKYAHITYFLGGGRESAWPGEKQVLIPSLKAKKYVEHPEMSAENITRTVIDSLQKTPYDVYLINYANPDMVGHSGDLQATIKAIEYLDQELAKLYDVIVKNMQGTMIITADHGNAEDKWDPITQQPRTAHTCNPVPFVVISAHMQDAHKKLPLTSVADIAPFMLHLLHIPIPHEMKRKIS